MKQAAEKVGCGELARARGHIAVRRSGGGVGSPLRGEVLFAVCFLSSLMSSLVMAGLRSLFPSRFPFRLTDEEVSMIRFLCGDREEAYITEYERGGPPGPWERHGVGRYSVSPPIGRLMKDLARPAARDDALDVLLARLDDPVTRDWVMSCVQAGHLHRLRLHVRPRAKEEVVFGAWRTEAEAEAEAEAELADAADGVGSDGPPSGLVPNKAGVN
ncbi:hypothetical protein [Microvirga sp. 2TAF3]|uniref:hypothetical protein n=1 Tax=Microvirga sp. 2TAF3 TaxID=3233014 RepID=UPI003F9D6786